MKSEYRTVISRILGNDLPPRHSPDQTFNNTKFILENERKFTDTSRVWFLNRIADQDKAQKLRNLLLDAGENFIEMPFIPEVYAELKTEREKLMYATNLNQARNYLIEFSLRMPGTDVALVLDGAAYLPDAGFYPFEELIYKTDPQKEAAYAIPAVRVESYEEALSPDFVPVVKETVKFGNGQSLTGMREPYLAFTHNCDVRYNEDLLYGQVPKVELLWRLGMVGAWDRWEPEIKKEALKHLSAYAGTVKSQGYAIRLPTGTPDGAADNLVRGHNRNKGKALLLKNLETLVRS